MRGKGGRRVGRWAASLLVLLVLALSPVWARRTISRSPAGHCARFMALVEQSLRSYEEDRRARLGATWSLILELGPNAPTLVGAGFLMGIDPHCPYSREPGQIAFQLRPAGSSGEWHVWCPNHGTIASAEAQDRTEAERRRIRKEEQSRRETWYFWAGLLFVFVFPSLYRKFMVWRIVSSMVFQCPEVRPLHKEEIDADTLAFLQAYADRLQEYGFVVRGFFLETSIQRAPCDRRPGILLEQPELLTWAMVVPGEYLEPVAPGEICFKTWLEDGSGVLTANGLASFTLGEIPATRTIDADAPTIAGHWQRHREAIAAAGNKGLKPVAVPAHALLERENRWHAAYWDHLLTTGELAAGPEQGASLPADRVFPYIAKVENGTKTLMDLFRRMHEGKTDHPQVAIPAAHETGCYRKMMYTSQPPPPSARARLILFVVSVVLGALALSILMNPQAVVIILIVLFIHELGHFAGFALLGGGARQMLFLPFMGAAVTGDDRNTTPLQRMLISLLGPLPGIVLGCLLMAWVGTRGSGVLHEFAFMSIFINLFNLLPFAPLDGGNIIHIIFSARRAGCGSVLWRVIGGLFFLALGITIFEAVTLVLGVLLLWGALFGRERKHLENRLKERLFADRVRITEDDLFPAMTVVLRESSLASANIYGKSAMVLHLHSAVPRCLPTPADSVLGLIMYLGAWFTPLLVLFL